jgi:deazaflavin-dependent oxidoreductase (nitroreductase family)
MMTQHVPEFREPSPAARLFNRIFGALVGLGLGARHNYLVEVRGRKTGRVYSAPVNVVELGGRRFLVAPRGRTQWVRNAEAAGQLVLRKGRRRQAFRLRTVPDQEKPEILKAYLDRFKLMVQSYFPVTAGSDEDAFRDLADRYPVFELLPSDEATPRY